MEQDQVLVGTDLSDVFWGGPKHLASKFGHMSQISYNGLSFMQIGWSFSIKNIS